MLSAMLYLIPFLAGIAMSLRLGPVLIFMVYQLDYFLNPQNKWWGRFVTVCWCTILLSANHDTSVYAQVW